MGLQSQSWIFNIFRAIFAFLDTLVYGLIKLILWGAFDLASLTTSSNLLNDIYSRIYVLLGIFMAFKLSFSFFQYIVDPDSMTGKSEKGVSKLIGRTAVMLIALVSLPTLLFSNDSGGGLINRAQNAFLPMLPRVLLGISSDSGISAGNDSDIEAIADTMAATTMQAFFAPSPELDSACGEGTFANTPNITSLGELIQNVNMTCDNGGFAGTGLGAPKYYKYSYLCLVSTIVGVLMVLMILGISIDIAKRVFKMIILEVIAPIPIMSLIDPKSSKDGAFSHWIKSLISTFIDIFLKLGLLYIVLVLIQLIVSRGLFENFPDFSQNPIRGSYLTVFLILGLIFFAKEAPKFIKDSLGIKDSGNGLGTGLGAAVGAVGGLVGGHGLSGMLNGAMAGANADPKVGAWASGRDTAGQLRTGDKNWRGGIANGIQRKTSRQQQLAEARKYGVTNSTMDAAKKTMITAESAADTAEKEYQEALYRGDDQATIESLRKEATEKRGYADSAKRNYESMSEVAKQYGVKRGTAEEMREKRRNPVFRAARRTGESISTAATAVRGAFTHPSEVGTMVSERRAQHADQRELERIQDVENKSYFDPYNRKDLNTEHGSNQLADDKKRMEDGIESHRQGSHHGATAARTDASAHDSNYNSGNSNARMSDNGKK